MGSKGGSKTRFKNPFAGGHRLKGQSPHALGLLIYSIETPHSHPPL